MCLAQKSAMRVKRELTAELDLSILDEIERATRLEITQGFELEQHNIGETVVDLQKVHVLRCHASHGERARRGVAQTDLERIRP